MVISRSVKLVRSLRSSMVYCSSIGICCCSDKCVCVRTERAPSARRNIPFLSRKHPFSLLALFSRISDPKLKLRQLLLLSTRAASPTPSQQVSIRQPRRNLRRSHRIERSQAAGRWRQNIFSCWRR